jgi:archaellin
MPGDIVEIEVHTWPFTTGLTTRTPVSLAIIPGSGSAIIGDFKTPSSYASDKIITLR